MTSETPIEGCFLLDATYVINHQNFRVVRPMSQNELNANGIKFMIQETYFSRSQHRVIRGLHFMLPPATADRLVMCIEGGIMDFVIDLRTTSKSYLKSFSVLLTEDNYTSIFVPGGLAHGFATLTEKALVLYQSSKLYDSRYDSGIRWDSVGFEWPVADPILSDRDLALPPLSTFESPF